MHLHVSRILAAVAGSLMLVFAGDTLADDAHLAVADYLEFEQVADAQISPDGNRDIPR